MPFDQTENFLSNFNIGYKKGSIDTDKRKIMLIKHELLQLTPLSSCYCDNPEAFPHL